MNDALVQAQEALALQYVVVGCHRVGVYYAPRLCYFRSRLCSEKKRSQHII